MKLRLTVGILVTLIQLFLYINADWIYGPYADQARNVLLAYFILTTVVLASFAVKLPTLDVGEKGLYNFFVGFVLTSVFMLLIPKALQARLASIETTAMALGFGLLHGFVKAYNEEIVFRGILPKALGGGLYADVLSNILFGLFHLAVTGASLPAIFLLSILGMIWAFIRNRIGLMGSTGSHFAYNLGVMGVLDKIFSPGGW